MHLYLKNLMKSMSSRLKDVISRLGTPLVIARVAVHPMGFFRPKVSSIKRKG
jgi:hypothetical protein